MKKIDKSIFKMSPDELEQWLRLRKAGKAIDNRKGKGSYKRKPKYPSNENE